MTRRMKLVLLPVLLSAIHTTTTRWSPFVTAFSATTAHSSTARSTSGSCDREHEAAFIFLHGLGDTPDGWKTLEDALPSFCPSLEAANIKYVFPKAATVELTVNGGARMPGWFDVYDWPIGITAKDDPRGLAFSVRRLEKIVDELKEEDGIDPSRIFVGGFGQGAAVALMAAYNRRNKENVPFAGCVCLSGWLPMKDYLKVSKDTAKATPLLWAHGEHDNKILFEQHVYGVKKLRDAGVTVIATPYAVGHESSNFEEIEEMAEFLDDVLASKHNEEIESQRAAAEASEKAASEVTDDVLLYALCALEMETFMDELTEQVPVALPS